MTISRRELMRSGLTAAGGALVVAGCKRPAGSQIKEITPEQQAQILSASNAYSKQVILRDIAHAESILKAELERSAAGQAPINANRDTGDSEFWDVYLESYDHVTRTPGYQQMGQTAADSLKGIDNLVVADLGAGLGQVARTVMQTARVQMLYLVDTSAAARNAWSKTFAGLPYESVSADIAHYALPSTVNAVIINNALFALRDEDQPQVVERVLTSLTAPGSVLYLNEPSAAISTRDGIATFLKVLAADLVQLRSMSEFAFAMIVNTNLTTLVDQLQRRRSSLEPVVAKASSQGFTVSPPKSAYYGATETVIFTRA